MIPQLAECEGEPLARQLLAACLALDLTLAVAESLTGGALAASLVDVPGASAVFRGGVVAYATPLKHRVLGVDGDLLKREGPVHPQVARQMARGVTQLMKADVGLATTGVAGPGPADGAPAGRVYVACAFLGGGLTRELNISGGRANVRSVSVIECMRLTLEGLGELGMGVTKF